MESWPYFAVASTLPEFIQALRRSKPSGDLVAWMSSAVGVTPSVVPQELGTLRRLGWADDQSVTERGWALRGEEAAKEASEVLQRYYSDLLQVVERTPEAPVQALRSWLHTNSKLGEVALSRVIRTFLAVRELAQSGTIESTLTHAKRTSGAHTHDPRRPKARTPQQDEAGADDDERDLRSEVSRLKAMIAADARGAGGSLTPAVQEITFPLREGGVIRILAPRALRADDVKRIHALVDLLVVEDNA